MLLAEHRPTVVLAHPGAEPGVLVHGCHGGAGTTTLARLLELPELPVGHEPSSGAQVVLVARGTPYGARRAIDRLAELREEVSVAPIALVLVGDGPWPEPHLVRLRARLLDPLVPTVYRLPYVPRWRYVDDPLARHLPRAITTALARVRAVLPPDGGTS